MSRLLLIVALATPALCCVVAVPAGGAQALDGWSGYKFGMSPDAARAVPGQVFGPYSPKNLMNENRGAMGAKKDATLFGLPWALDLFFDPSEKLNEITLENERKSSRDDCEKTFLTVLAQLEKSYGGLSTVNPQRKRNDADTPPTSLEWRALGGSHYEFATVALEDEYAFVWKARKNTGGNTVVLTASWSGKPEERSSPCVTNMDYNGK
jgi:hypothetical protein